MVLTREGLDVLIDEISGDYDVVGPVRKGDAIGLDVVDNPLRLALGSTTEQDAGHYRRTDDPDGWLFGSGPTADSWRRFLFPPKTLLVRIRRTDGSFACDPRPESDRPMAFIGVRSCDLSAIGVTDRVFTEGDVADPDYSSRRRDVLIVAIGCRDSTASCFCASMGTGPNPERGFDLLLTEVAPGPDHRIVARAASTRGHDLMSRLNAPTASDADHSSVESATRAAAASQTRSVDPRHVMAAATAHDHPRWDDVAQRCLSCTSCTLVCPTCFCSTIEDSSTLDGSAAERWRRWDSCFADGHSLLGGQPVRNSTASRYRQWLLHKLVTWQDQFDVSGCVGCGRCITWCPPGIDITEEIAAVGGGS